MEDEYLFSLDLYDILGIPFSSSPETIQYGYRKNVWKIHPGNVF